jgi:hypothetical protein
MCGRLSHPDSIHKLLKGLFVLKMAGPKYEAYAAPGEFGSESLAGSILQNRIEHSKIRRFILKPSQGACTGVERTYDGLASLLQFGLQVHGNDSFVLHEENKIAAL